MNSAYLYDTQAASSAITNRIYYLLETRHWSIKTLSDESNIPYETLKKLLAKKTENTSIHNIVKIALAFNCNLNELIQPLERNEILPNYLNEVESSFDFCTSVQKTQKIPVFTPHSLYYQNTSEFMCRDNTIDIISIPCHAKQEVEYGIRICTLCYHPLYRYGDILLISRKHAPRLGEAGVFLHQDKLHIRIFQKAENCILLKAVNHLGPDIKIHDFSNWKIIGCVAGIQRA